jgi:glutamate-ammonia-ligase adenylyltransferase
MKDRGMTQQHLQENLISRDGNPDEVRALLLGAGFEDWRAAHRAILRMTENPQQREAFAKFLPHLIEALREAPGPEGVINNLERLIHTAPDPVGMCAFLALHPRTVENLVRIFSGSQFLSEILLRTPDTFEQLADPRRMAVIKSSQEFSAEVRGQMASHAAFIDRMDALRSYQRKELLRIGVCDLLDLFDLSAATLQLSYLADSLIEGCLHLAAEHAGLPVQGFVVIGMGKLGGCELNYSSDIDLLFLSQPVSASATRIGEKLIDALARLTTEGFLYRVDMRLRPWGKVGPLVSSPDGFIGYLAQHALLWEKQALLKGRVVAGDRSVGESFLNRARPMLLEGQEDAVRADVYAMKQRTEAFLQEKGKVWGDVKLGEGSIRDVEFVVQFLQLAHGDRHPEILSPNTLDALARCLRADFISPDEYRALTDGYTFLRTIEHHLQMMDYRQTHTLPEDPGAIAHLAQRLGYGNGPERSDSQSSSGRKRQAGEQFLARYRQYSAAIRKVYLRYIGRLEMEKPNVPRSSPGSVPLNVDVHRQRMSPSYAETFTDEEIDGHAAMANQLGDERLVIIDAHPAAGGNWQVTIVAADFPGELSLICGLMFVYGFDIIEGNVFTYGADGNLGQKSHARERSRKIVDVFTVRPVINAEAAADLWPAYEQDLNHLLRMLQGGQAREARGELAKRVANQLYKAHQGPPPGELLEEPELEQAASQGDRLDSAPSLYPVEIEFDNQSSELYTVLQIEAPDTTGFLYEFTNALAIYKIYIDRMIVSTVGSRVNDTLFVTDEHGEKITDPDKQRELRAATVLIKHFTHLLPYTPNPESALLHFREFIGQLFKRPNWPDELGSLERPEVLHALARLLGVSDFLWDDFLRMQYANLYPVVRDVDALETAKSRDELQAELEGILMQVHPAGQQPVAVPSLNEDAQWRKELNDFKDREMFRIDMRHILGHTSEFWDFAAELTDLAEVVVNSAFHLCHEDLRAVYGAPMLENGEPSEMVVCALGKCGGRELGFASDIELMFVYSGNGKTTGPQVITSAEFYEKLVTTFVRAIRARREGIFEIDLQLRPYGKAGSLSVTLDAFRRYFASEGPAWAYERQALVKLRPVAGNLDLGERVTELRDAFVFTGQPYDVTAMRAMRERQVRHLVAGGRFNLKYSPGGLVDIEYLVQGLQITHGAAHPELRLTNTREAMAALAVAGIINQEDYARLRKAHTFLRWLIDALRMVRGSAKDVTVPPEESEEFAFLARRMPYGRDTTRLQEALTRYTQDVLQLNTRLFAS